MKKFAYNCMEDYVTLSGPELSPDGRYVVFGSSKADYKKDGNKSALWKIDLNTGEQSLLAERGLSGGVFCSNTELVFACPGKNKNETLFKKLDITCGEAEEFFTLPLMQAAAKPIWDGKWLVCSVVDQNEEGDGTTEMWDTYTEYPFRGNGRGYLNAYRRALHIYDPKTKELKRFSPKWLNACEAMFYGNTPWAEMSQKKVYYWGHEYEHYYDKRSMIYVYDDETGENTLLAGPVDYEIHSGAFAHGKLYLSADYVNYGTDFLHARLYTVEDGKMVSVLDNEETLNGLTAIDGEIYFKLQERDFPRVCKLINGKAETVYDTDVRIGSWRMAGGRSVAVGSRPGVLSEVYEITGNMAKKLTNMGADFAAEYELSPVHPITFPTELGVPGYGWVVPPADYVPGTKYPGVLFIHGGPQGRFNDLINPTAQHYSAAGYFVFYCNPRGSDGQGREFMHVSGKYGTIDYDDLMHFTDKVLAAWPDIDASRLCVTGGSYGGFMTNWIIGHTDRFCAAASIVSTCNDISMLGTGDIRWYDEIEQNATPWKNYGELWWHSPLKYVGNVKTPTIFLQNGDDFRCSVDQAEEMFTALMHLGVESRMLVFKGASHSVISPVQSRRRTEEIIKWFDRYTGKADK